MRSFAPSMLMDMDVTPESLVTRKKRGRMGMLMSVIVIECYNIIIKIKINYNNKNYYLKFFNQTHGKNFNYFIFNYIYLFNFICFISSKFLLLIMLIREKIKRNVYI